MWWDQQILPGQDWQLAIRQALKDSYAVILCLCKEAQARATSGIHPEALDAIDAYRQYPPGAVFLIPVRLSECEIPPLKISENTYLDSLHCVDLFPRSRRDDGLQRLLPALLAAPGHPWRRDPFDQGQAEPDATFRRIVLQSHERFEDALSLGCRDPLAVVVNIDDGGSIR